MDYTSVYWKALNRHNVIGMDTIGEDRFRRKRHGSAVKGTSDAGCALGIHAYIIARENS